MFFFFGNHISKKAKFSVSCQGKIGVLQGWVSREFTDFYFHFQSDSSRGGMASEPCGCKVEKNLKSESQILLEKAQYLVQKHPIKSELPIRACACNITSDSLQSSSNRATHSSPLKDKAKVRKARPTVTPLSPDPSIVLPPHPPLPPPAPFSSSSVCGRNRSGHRSRHR